MSALDDYLVFMGDTCDHHRDECPDDCPRLGQRAEAELAALRREGDDLRLIFHAYRTGTIWKAVDGPWFFRNEPYPDDGTGLPILTDEARAALRKDGGT